jgi:hypothetical protein
MSDGKLSEGLDPIFQRIKASALRRGLSKQEAFDSGFHMVDWLDDLGAFYSFCQNPDSLTDGELDTMLNNFLIHVPNHVAAAAKIYADYPVSDVFQIDVFRSSEDDSSSP